MSTSAKDSKAAKLKGFKHSRPGLYLSIGSSAFGVFGIARDVKKARSENDTLMLVNAVVAAVALVTSTALLVRELRQLGSDDVLLG